MPLYDGAFPDYNKRMNTLILFANLFSTIYMTGVIWVIQVVHYPLFAKVGSDAFIPYAADHNNLITLVVLPPMLVEAGTAAWFILSRPEQMPAWAAWAGLILVGIVWFSTFFLQVPQHSILLRGVESNAHNLLVGTNWLRTVGWTARSVLMLWVLNNMIR